MEGRKNDYRYRECGLDSVVLKDILVFHCTQCNAIVPEVPMVGILHRVIALRLLRKDTRLAGSELRYLRNLCGYSVSDFAKILGSDKTVISRWETKGPGKGTDRTVRLLVLFNFIKEIIGREKPMLTNITPDQLIREIEDSLKILSANSSKDENYEISPEDIARFAETPQETQELTHVQ
jgi:transcriptional regulator with XRE-family HTH domain